MERKKGERSRFVYLFVRFKKDPEELKMFSV